MHNYLDMIILGNFFFLFDIIVFKILLIIKKMMNKKYAKMLFDKIGKLKL